MGGGFFSKGVFSQKISKTEHLKIHKSRGWGHKVVGVQA